MLAALLVTLLDFRVLSVFSVVFFIALAYVKSRKPRGLPPGPKTQPFIGNLKLLSFNDQLHKTFLSLRREYGGIFSLQLGWYPAVVISDYELLKEALIRRGSQCSNRFSHLFLMNFIPTARAGVVSSEGVLWKEARKLAVNSLRDFGVAKATIEGKVLEEAENIVAEVRKNSGQPYSFDLLFRKATSNVMSAMLFGKRFDYEDQEFIGLLRSIEKLLEMANSLTKPYVLLPYLLPAFFLGSSNTMRVIAGVNNLAKRQLDQHKETFDPDNLKDFIDVFLDNSSQMSNNPIYTDRSCVENIQNLFIAGTDTTSGSLTWTMLFMVRHPEVQDKCREEITEVIGSQRKPSLEDRDSMPYVEATLYESLRLCPIAPHAIAHSTEGEVSLGGYTLPNDTVIIPDIYSIHMDPDTWQSPEEFRPERFIDEEGKLQRPTHFIPFSIGRRSCVGEQLARTELFLFFTSLLQSFKFTCEDVRKLPTIHDASMGITLVTAPYKVIATPL